MQIVFCTTCKGRAQHIEQTLPQNLKDNNGTSKFVLLDYNSPDHLREYLQSSHQADIESGKLTVYHHTEPGPFRMAHAKNMAHRLGILEGADVLVNLDADNFTGQDFAGYIGEQMQNPQQFMWARKDPGDGRPRGISGRIIVTRAAFLAAGGYDEKYTTWSPDDKDFHARLERMGYSPLEIDIEYLSAAVAHNDRMRFREYPEAESMGTYEFDLVRQARTTVVNFGQIGTGVVFRNFEPLAIEIGKLPTRIFGIGMHKTATTSLHNAFRILGFDSAHWKSAHWAKAIWEEMKSAGRSPTLEKSYCLTDLPIPILYQELDRAYPGSKFILTIRDEHRWLKSVRNHWSHEHNKFRADWSTDPFTHQVHKELYGQKGFDAELFLSRYRRHNADVFWYFRNRPEDLLVMDMDRGAGWPDLCRFLNQPVPTVEYPMSFRTGGPR